MNGPASTGTAPARRADAGTVRLGERDVAGLVLLGDMYGAPYDLRAPRGALPYSRCSREELGGRFLGLMANPALKG